jgi:hypothetical protein
MTPRERLTNGVQGTTIEDESDLLLAGDAPPSDGRHAKDVLDRPP